MSGYWWLLAGLAAAAVGLSVTGFYLLHHDKETGDSWDS